MSQKNRYLSLVIAGFGSIGQGVIKLGDRILSKFEKVVIVDKREMGMMEIGRGYTIASGDIKDRSFLDNLITGLPKPVIFLNLSPDMDTFSLRYFLSKYPVAYLDSGAGIIPGDYNRSMQRVMEYVTRPVKSPYPHLICQGINPGIVELMARVLMAKMGGKGGLFDIEVIEIDTFTTSIRDEKIPVAWSPEDFLEEMSVFPTFEKRDGLFLEYPLPVKEVKVLWKGKEMLGRIVAHEDIWSLSRIEGVIGARFVYSLNDYIMEAIRLPFKDVIKRLYVPDDKTPVYGTDTIILKVSEIKKSASKAICWSVDHYNTWESYRINGVQYQTGTSLLFSINLFLNGIIQGRDHPYTLSSIPLKDGNFECLEKMLEETGISWNEMDINSVPEVVEHE